MGKKPFTVRDFFVLKTLAPSLNLTMDMEGLPLSVNPEQKVSLADTNRLAQVSRGHGRKLIEPAVLSFEQKAVDEMPLIENKVLALIREGKKDKAQAQAYLTRYSFDFIYSTLRCWEEMEGQLWHKFGRGF